MAESTASKTLSSTNSSKCAGMRTCSGPCPTLFYRISCPHRFMFSCRYSAKIANYVKNSPNKFVIRWEGFPYGWDEEIDVTRTTRLRPHRGEDSFRDSSKHPDFGAFPLTNVFLMSILVSQSPTLQASCTSLRRGALPVDTSATLTTRQSLM